MEPNIIMRDDGRLLPGQVALANEARFTESYFSEPLTAYAAGWRDPNNLEATLEFVAPAVPTARRFEFKKAANSEEFLSETDDERSLGADFKRVEFTGTTVNEKTINKGLTMRVDLDQVAAQPNWRQVYTGRLMRRILRNDLRRALVVLAAAATNTAKTWDASAGKDPDQDVMVDLVTATNSSGIRPNRVLYGDTAWAKRGISHRAQNSAGGFGSAGMTPETLAQLLGVSGVLVSRERYQSSASAKSEIVNNLVLEFYADSGQTPEDPSNIKRFISPVEGGGLVRVYEQPVSSKLVDLTVEHYSNLVITSTLGIRKLTIS